MFAFKIVVTTVIILWTILLAWMAATTENNAKGVVGFVLLTYIAAIAGMWL